MDSGIPLVVSLGWRRRWLPTSFQVAANGMQRCLHCPPSKTAQLADTSYTLSWQAVAAANNVTLLSASLSRMSICQTSFSEAEVEEVSHLSGDVLHLNQALAVCSVRVMANSVVTQRHLRLSLTAIKEADITLLLNAPISDDSILGVTVVEATESF